MEIKSLRHLRRRQRLEHLRGEAGGVTALASIVETPKSHISALLAGRRGIGDELAHKIEDKLGKPRGWLDQSGDISDEAAEFALLYDAIPEGREKERTRAVIGALLRGDVPTLAPPRPVPDACESPREATPAPAEAQ